MPTKPNEPINGTLLHDGLTKREYFAAMAMQGLAADNELNPNNYTQTIAKIAVEMADKLIIELNK